MGHLWGNQAHFDKNGNGRLSGMEWSNWYLSTYGVDIEMDERRRAARTKSDWAQWKTRTLTIIESAYSIVLEKTEALLGSVEKEKVQHCFLYWMTCGLTSTNLWSVKKSTNVGMFVGNSVFYPYRAIVEGFLQLHPDAVTYKEFDRAIKDGRKLFSEEGTLSEAACGTYWRDLIQVLPAYHEYAIPEFGCTSIFVKYDSEEDTEKARQLCNLMEALFPIYSFFSGKTDAAADEADNQLRELFERYWQELGLQEEIEPEEEYDEEEESEDSKESWEEPLPIVVPNRIRQRKSRGTDPEDVFDDGTVYQYCMVHFPEQERTYSYRYEGIILKQGDFVAVPYGRQNIERIGCVSGVGEYTASTAPYPPKKTKMVIRKDERTVTGDGVE